MALQEKHRSATTEVMLARTRGGGCAERCKQQCTEGSDRHLRHPDFIQYSTGIEW